MSGAEQSAAQHAAAEVAAGDVGGASRPVLGVLTVLLFAAFALDTWAVVNARLLSIDLPVARFVQGITWGPLTDAMQLTNAVGGSRQVLVGAAAVLLLALVDRRAGWLMALGSLASLTDNLLKLSFERHRPTADLVHVLTPATGYSYPSGHAVFFTWLSFMAAFSVAPLVRPIWRGPIWALAALVTVVACLGRVWAGVHWPSDVLGGFLLALGWSTFVLWLPERWVPRPSLGWLSPARRR